jgi:hypothetical protein
MAKIMGFVFLIFWAIQSFAFSADSLNANAAQKQHKNQYTGNIDVGGMFGFFSHDQSLLDNTYFSNKYKQAFLYVRTSRRHFKPAVLYWWWGWYGYTPAEI